VVGDVLAHFMFHLSTGTARGRSIHTLLVAQPNE
jgi:hypothetical protein